MDREFHEMVREAVRDEAALRSALAEADIAPMLMVLVQLTGEAAYGRGRGEWTSVIKL